MARDDRICVATNDNVKQLATLDQNSEAALSQKLREHQGEEHSELSVHGQTSIEKWQLRKGVFLN